LQFFEQEAEEDIFFKRNSICENLLLPFILYMSKKVYLFSESKFSENCYFVFVEDFLGEEG